MKVYVLRFILYVLCHCFFSYLLSMLHQQQCLNSTFLFLSLLFKHYFLIHLRKFGVILLVITLCLRVMIASAVSGHIVHG